MTVVIETNQSGDSKRRSREQLLQDFAEGQYLTQEIFQGLIESVALLSDIYGDAQGEDMLIQARMAKAEQNIATLQSQMTELQNQMLDISQRVAAIENQYIDEITQ